MITNDGKKIILDRTYNSSPTLSAPAQFKVGTGNTEATINDTDLENPVNIDGDNFKAFESGYPTQDTNTLTNTIRCFLNSLEANGNNLSEFGIVNGDGTPLLFSRTVHTAINKTSSNEITYIIKERIL